MRFCVDCKFCVEVPQEDTEPICAAVQDMVTGKIVNRTCREARAGTWMCGPEAKLFKQRGEMGADPRKVYGEAPNLDVSSGTRRDMKPGKSDG